MEEFDEAKYDWIFLTFFLIKQERFEKGVQNFGGKTFADNQRD